MASAALMGAGLLGGFLGSKGAGEAAKTMNQGTLDANSRNWLLYGQQRQDQAPYMDAGKNAVNYLQYLMGMGGGPNGQVSNSGPSSNAILNKPLTMTTAGMDGKTGSIKANGANSFQWTPGSGNGRTYQFLYNDGQNDVYQRTGGGKGTGVNIDYAIVGKDGNVQLSGNPPVPGSGVQSGGQPQVTDAMKNDPNFGSLMKDFSTSDFQADPGYQFRLAEGQKALERSAASKGGLFSGGTLKDLTNYNQGAASNEFTNAYNRYQTNRTAKLNPLLAMAGMGQTSAQTINGSTSNLMDTNNQNTMGTSVNEANARASGYAAWGQGINNGLQSAMNWYQMQQQNKDN